MEKLYKNDKLYHCFFNADDFTDSRVDVTPEEENLQCAVMHMNNGKSFDPHVHIPCHRNTDTTQESWVVLKGKIRITYYDEDCQEMGSAVLTSGGCTISFIGGHKYECLEDDTVVYEFKTGPYYGKDADKRIFQL